MPKWVERTLGSESLTYIRESLGYGRALATRMLGELDLDAGTVMTCVSEGVPEEWITRFKMGGVVKHERKPPVPIAGPRMELIPNADRWLASVIQQFVRGDERRVCILEHTLASASDPWVRRARGRVMLCGVDVYQVVSSVNSETSEIEAAVRKASWMAPPMVGALTEWAGDFVPPDTQREISSEQIAAMASMAQAVIVSAYDGESYLIWRRSA